MPSQCKRTYKSRGQHYKIQKIERTALVRSTGGNGILGKSAMGKELSEMRRNNKKRNDLFLLP
jgi:hypothetical protein